MHKAENGEYDREKCKLPHYLPKDGFTTLVIGFVRLNGNQLILPYAKTLTMERCYMKEMGMSPHG